MNLHDNLI